VHAARKYCQLNDRVDHDSISHGDHILRQLEVICQPPETGVSPG
jgi:hypothetical protein